MYLVAIAWIYVVLMMAVAEALSPQGTVVGAVFTALLYGALPLSIVLYILATPGRRKALRAAEAQADALAAANAASAAMTTTATETATRTAPAPAAAAAAAQPAASHAPDGGGHAAGDAVATERKEG